MIEKIIIKFNDFFSKKNLKLKLFNQILSFLSLIYIFDLFSNLNYSFNINKNIFLAMVFIFIAYLLQALSWSLILNNSFNSQSVNVWLTTLIGKYIPFKIGSIVMRYSKDYELKLIERNSKKYLSSILKEITLQILTGFSFVILFILSALEMNIFVRNLFFVLIFFLLFYKINKKKIYLIYIFNLLSYLAFAFSFNTLISGYFNGDSIVLSLFYIFVSLLTILFIGAPAGLGIREFLYVYILQKLNMNFSFEESVLTETAINLRLLLIFSDLLIYFFMLIFNKYAKN